MPTIKVTIKVVSQLLEYERWRQLRRRERGDDVMTDAFSESVDEKSGAHWAHQIRWLLLYLQKAGIGHTIVK
ncbi:hypothetical protein GCM10009129_20750 [Psychrobacter aestuarii]|uniref:Uncharacterized protein n=1 Tax=Psychrobacter aestuarii TaxID=556327 RepID=A0ABN0W1S1_9GAMM